MARPSSFKKGGGFLNNVDATIVDYEFTDDVITREGREPFKPGKVKGGDGKLKERFHSLNMILSVLVDGADEPVTTTLFGGGAEDFDISEDGKTLTPVQEGNNVGASTGVGKFVTTLCHPTSSENDGFPEDNFDEDPNTINFEPMIGTRVRLVQQVDEAATKKYGKRKSKDGKEYNRTDLVVAEVYEVGDGTFEAPAKGKNAKKATNGSGKTMATKGKTTSKSQKDDEEEDEVDVPELALDAVKRYLEIADGSLSKSKIRSKVLQDKEFSGKGELREAVIKQIYDDKWLSKNFTYDKSDKAQMVSLEG